MKNALGLLSAALLATSASAHELAGRVLDAEGKPVANARVLAAESSVARILYASPTAALTSSWSDGDPAVGVGGALAGDATTDALGRFAIGELRDARFSLLAFEPAQGFAQRSDASASAGADPIELRLEPPAALEVRLAHLDFDPSRHLVELVALAPSGNVRFLPNAVVMADGSFRFAPLPAGRDWVVQLTEWVQERGFRATLLREPVRALASSDARLALDLADPIGPLAGVVRGTEGEALADVCVVARSAVDPARERGARTGADGRYAIHGLGPGAWELEATRWTLRRTPGCGLGPRDVYATRAIELPLAAPELADLRADASIAALRVGEAAPAFDVVTTDGRALSLAALRGKVVLVDFWASWCGLCRADFPALRETYARFGGGTDFEIVGASIDEDPALAVHVATSVKLVWPQTALGPVETNPLARLFNVASTPSSFLIDREGKIVGVDLRGDELRAALEQLFPRDR